MLHPVESPQSPVAAISITKLSEASGEDVEELGGTFARIVPFSMRKIPSSTVPASIVSPARARAVILSPKSIEVSQSEFAISNRSSCSEVYPAT